MKREAYAELFNGMNEHYDFEYLIKRDAINAAKGHAQVISIK